MIPEFEISILLSIIDQHLEIIHKHPTLDIRDEKEALFELGIELLIRKDEHLTTSDFKPYQARLLLVVSCCFQKYDDAKIDYY